MLRSTRPHFLPGRRLTRLVTAAALAQLTALPLSGVAGAAPAPGTRAPACNVNWVGHGKTTVWNDPANWSTDQVPGPSSDVCISSSTYLEVFATGNIMIHSLQNDAGLGIGETTGAPDPSTLDVTTVIDNEGSLGLYDSTVESPKITSYNLYSNGPQGTSGMNLVESPDFSNTGDVAAFSGTLQLDHSPVQLSDGILSGGEWDVFGDGTSLVLPGPITNISAGLVNIDGTGEITDTEGSALSGLQTIGAGGTLAVAQNTTPLSISGNLTSSGDVQLGNYDESGSLAIAGTYTNIDNAAVTLFSGSRLQAALLVVGAGASLSGDSQATIDGNVENAGSVGVGGTALMIIGDYVQAASGSLEAGDGSEVNISAHAILAGALVIPVGVPAPRPGSRSTALTFAASTGHFASHTIGFRLVPEGNQIDVVAHPQIAMAPRTVDPGAPVTISGGDFPYETTVDLYIDHATRTPFATASVDIHGYFQTSATIPTGMSQGLHTMIAIDGSLKVKAPFHVS